MPAPQKPADPHEPAAYLDMPPERRLAAKAHAAMLSVTMRKVAADIPFQADVDDFRRVLTAAPKAGESKAGESKAGESKAGESKAGESKAGEAQ